MHDILMEHSFPAKRTFWSSRQKQLTNNQNQRNADVVIEDNCKAWRRFLNRKVMSHQFHEK